MNIRATPPSKWVKLSLFWLAGLARIFVALYAIGNLGFHLANWIVKIPLFDPLKNHAVLIQFWIRASLALTVVFIVFPRQSRSRFKFGRGDGYLGFGLAALCIGVQVTSAISGGATTNANWNLTQLQIAYLLSFTFSAALTEELLCRFLILDQGRGLVGVVVAFCLQALIFSYIHIESLIKGQANFYLLLSGGALLGAIYLCTRSVYGALIFHITYNVLVVCCFGGSFDGAQIYPVVILDNFSKGWSMTSAIAFNVIATAIIVVVMRGPRGILARRSWGSRVPESE